MSQPPLLHLPAGTDLKGRIYGCDCPCAVCTKRRRNFPQIHTGHSQSCPVELSLAPTIPAPCAPPSIHQCISESVRVPREWRDGEWLNAFSNSKLLFSFYGCEAEAKGTRVTLAHTTGPEVTSNFLNTIPKAQRGPLGFPLSLPLQRIFPPLRKSGKILSYIPIPTHKLSLFEICFIFILPL